MAEYAISTAETATGRKLSLVIPVYYNAGALPEVFADDDSGGDTPLERLKIKAARPATKINEFTRNFGAARRMLGATGEYTWRLLNPVTFRPESVIEESCF